MAPPLLLAVKRFNDRYPWLGPAVFVVSILYFVAQPVVASAWHHPGYSISRNTISDLGNTACGQYAGQSVCSPRHGLMNAAFILLGAVMLIGSLLIDQEFVESPRRERVAAFVGFSLLALGGLGALVVGVVPENSHHLVHIAGAGLAIGAGNAGILVLGLVLGLPAVLRWYMRVFAVVSLAALVLFAGHWYLGLGQGGMERIAAYPETVWLIWFGVYMFRSHPRIATGPGVRHQ